MAADDAVGERIEVFYSYSHKDEDLRDELEKHLSLLKRQGVISSWHDRRIGAGKEWEGKIDEHLNSARVILLLVSSDFLASDYCYDVEMKRALARHDTGEARVIPVILRALDWKGAPFAKLQALPKDGKAVTSWPNRDEAFTDVARGIRSAAEELRPKGVVSKEPSSVKRSGLPAIWNVPHNRNLNFTGREEQLDQLRKTLNSGQPAVLHGLGGMGKTQGATEYAYRNSGDYDLVWWVRSEEPAKLTADYAALASELSLLEKDEKDQKVIIEAVRKELARRPRWLLVFDNVREPEEVRGTLPAGGGHVLITSQNPNWRGVARPLQLNRMKRPESVSFLLKRTEQRDECAADGVAAAVGDLPLALEHAGAYMEETGTSLSDYVALFRKHEQELLKGARPPAGYEATVATTWTISFEKVQNESAAAADLLRLCAYLAPDDIPRSLLTEHSDELPKSLAEVVANPLSLNKAVAVLRRYSLIEATGDAISIHRLVQAVVRDWLGENEKRKWAEVAVRLVSTAFPYDSDNVRTWPVCARLLPHGLATAQHAEQREAAREETARLLGRIGMYLTVRASFAEAKSMLERALRIAEGAYGADHPEVATCVNGLGIVLHALGNLADARGCFKRALRIDEAAYGRDHPTVGRDVNNLGSVFKELGEFIEARACYERALKTQEAIYGSNHVYVATCVNNLGTVLQGLGELAEARACYERTLSIDVAAYGPDHPEVATDVNNLGEVLRELGELAAARACIERALKIDEAAYGPDHPDVARGLNNLGGVLKDLGDRAGARACYERALRICRESFGEEHSKTQLVRENLESLRPSK